MRKKYVEGDYFALSLCKDEEKITNFEPPYAFGRLIAINPSKDMVIEIFKHFGDLTNDIELITSSGRLFNPVCVAGYSRNNRWRRIAEDTNYNREKANFKEIKFDAGSYVWEGGVVQRPMKPEEKGCYEERIIYYPEQLELRIRKALGLE